MCVSPIKIPNPNYGATHPLVVNTVDTLSCYIKVPCNCCGECLAKRQASFVQRCRLESMTSHIFFCTLTYRDGVVPEITTSTGYTLKYADVQDVILMIKRLRLHNKFGRKFRYFAVSERGGKRGRPHFHILFFVEKLLGDDFLTCMHLERKYRQTVWKEWRRNTGTKLSPQWVKLSRYVESYYNGKLTRTYDFHYVNPTLTKEGISNVAYYVSKYMLKPSDKERRLKCALKLNLSSDEYDAIWNLVKSKCFKSLDFGCPTEVQCKYIRNSVSTSNTDPDGFKIVNPVNGFREPLCKYFYHKTKKFDDGRQIPFVTADDALKSVAARGGPLTFDNRSTTSKEISILHYEKVRQQIEQNEQSAIFPAG